MKLYVLFPFYRWHHLMLALCSCFSSMICCRRGKTRTEKNGTQRVTTCDTQTHTQSQRHYWTSNAIANSFSRSHSGRYFGFGKYFYYARDLSLRSLLLTQWYMETMGENMTNNDILMLLDGKNIIIIIVCVTRVVVVRPNAITSKSMGCINFHQFPIRRTIVILEFHRSNMCDK